MLKAEAEKCSPEVCFHALRRKENPDCCMQVAQPPKQRRGPGSATTQKGTTGSPAPTAHPWHGPRVQKVAEGEEGVGRGENAATCAEHRPAVPSGISLPPHPQCRSHNQAENVPVAPAGWKAPCHLATSCAFIPCHDKPQIFPPSCFPSTPPHIICRGEGTLPVIPRRYLTLAPRPNRDQRASDPSSQPVPLPRGGFGSRVLGAVPLAPRQRHLQVPPKSTPLGGCLLLCNWLEKKNKTQIFLRLHLYQSTLTSSGSPGWVQPPCLAETGTGAPVAAVWEPQQHLGKVPGSHTGKAAPHLPAEPK